MAPDRIHADIKISFTVLPKIIPVAKVLPSNESTPHPTQIVKQSQTDPVFSKSPPGETKMPEPRQNKKSY
jgi:hypothetical protein